MTAGSCDPPNSLCQERNSGTTAVALSGSLPEGAVAPGTALFVRSRCAASSGCHGQVVEPSGEGSEVVTVPRVGGDRHGSERCPEFVFEGVASISVCVDVSSKRHGFGPRNRAPI